jgi:hypothetical protein
VSGTPSTGYPVNTFGIDSTKRYQIVAQTVCKRITVQENYDSANPPTADYMIAQPAGGTQALVSKGVPFVFTPPVGTQWFYPTNVVGDIETVSGSITLQQVESQQV